MQTTVHAVPAPRRGRATGLLLAVLLQAGFVWALVAGLDIRTIRDVIGGPIEVFIPKPVKPMTPPPPTGPMAEPQVERMTPPDFVIDDGRPDVGIHLNPGPRTTGPADHGPVSLAATHTIPPYPPIAARLGQQGTVLLRLTISAQGVVTGAEVVRSSGYEVLDGAAQAWVLAHWRYQPAVRDGVAVPSTGTVAVRFDLRNAG